MCISPPLFHKHLILLFSAQYSGSETGSPTRVKRLEPTTPPPVFIATRPISSRNFPLIISPKIEDKPGGSTPFPDLLSPTDVILTMIGVGVFPPVNAPPISSISFFETTPVLAVLVVLPSGSNTAGGADGFVSNGGSVGGAIFGWNMLGCIIPTIITVPRIASSPPPTNPPPIILCTSLLC
ncbi:hypothetical protein AX774_g6247 [Zancudomyces culisetae]|uniref:Uncharacterized protein n=1 Tax=Zancudomyces culisetae TaxID=1213189 RepID=A0A1R1PH72_ZANCU|nr:hypothetical protein AX774_g6247 [Zancudomyces culisetae]|eukprot:OMH80320.1 hypothetical protein AX774_g6247 [Zancudomyces culisetae]